MISNKLALRRGWPALCLVLLTLILLLSGCSSVEHAPAAPASSPTPAPTPTPEPTPTPPPAHIVLGDESAEEILSLSKYSHIEEIDGDESKELDALLQLYSLMPECDVHWTYSFEGETLSSHTKELTAQSLEGLEDALKYLPELENVDLLACDVSVEQMDVYSAIRPETDFLWNIRFLEWEVRSDITCFSSLRHGVVSLTPRYTSEEYYPLLRYCRHLRALDLGHNDLDDLTLIGELTELQVLILVDNSRITDISPLAKLTELHYLELFMCEDIEDFSALDNLTKMQDLNLSYDKNLSDISFIDNMPDFHYGWFRNTKVTRDDVRPYQESRKGVRFVVGAHIDDITAICYGWRDTETNIAIRWAFAHWPQVVEYRYWNDVEYSKENVSGGMLSEN